MVARREHEGLVEVLCDHDEREDLLHLADEARQVGCVVARAALIVASQVVGQRVVRKHGEVLPGTVVGLGRAQESLERRVGHAPEGRAVLVVVAEERLEHGGGLAQDGDVDRVRRHEALQLGAVEAQVAGQHVRGPRGRVHEVGREVSRIAELVLAAGVRQGHGEVVPFCEAEQDVLHRGTRCLVSLQEGHGRVLGTGR
ncbi:hypothetical protein NN561_020393 [Cricetulus griseus]